MSTSKLLAIGASVKNNLAGSGPPASTDDSSAGYAAGSMLYECDSRFSALVANFSSQGVWELPPSRHR